MKGEKSNMPQSLPESEVEAIDGFIINNKYFIDKNPVEVPIGKKIFEIIEKRCLVFYYPIEDYGEDNDAFFFSNVPLRNGSSKNVISINTNVTEEKQVFAAAHELGHAEGVADHIIPGIKDTDHVELIVNRFAADLLMPSGLFIQFFNDQLSRVKFKDKINLGVLLQIIVNTMNHFSVPYKSVVIRLVETKMIPKEVGLFLVDGNDDINIKELLGIVDNIISNGTYSNLQTVTKKRSAPNIELLINEAEKIKDISETKLDRLCKEFGVIKRSKELLGNQISISDME